MIGSVARGTAGPKSDIDILITKDEADTLDDSLWKLNDGAVDAFYIDPYLKGASYFPPVCGSHDGIEPREGQIYLEAQTFLGARIITSKQLLDIVAELEAGKIPEPRGITWTPKSKAGKNLREERDRQLLELYESGFTQVELAEMLNLTQPNISRALRRARLAQ